MNAPIDLMQFMKELPSRARGKACIVLGQDYFNQKDWSKKLAKLTNANHIDLLERFANDVNLSKDIGHFHVQNLFIYLEGVCDTSVLVVSGLEFLFSTWIAQDSAMEQFLNIIKTWSKSPALMFIMQYDRHISEFDFGRRYSYTYVIDQKNTLAL
jgi:hypothetical protein